MNKTDLIETTTGITELMTKLSDLLSEKRKVEAQAKIAWEHAKEELEILATNLSIEIAERPEVANSVDPRTGKANVDWAKMITQQHLINDPGFNSASKKLYDARDALYFAQVDAQDVADRIGTARTQAILHSSLLRYLAAVDEDI